ncbi:MAG: type II toxin-antitoxin system MqsA family antitoxin [Muribaculaceae bacterium]|nr:type II toxin-antitoxin system MqsA family antitoxin [Muribaculaceae bacterium]
MDSPFCDGKATLIEKKTIIPYRKENFEITRKLYRCDQTGLEFSTEEQDEEAVDLIYDAYRKKHGIPSPSEIKSLREKYGLSASKMSLILGFGINQYHNYETGEVPSLSNAKLILAAMNPEFFKTLILLVKEDLGERTCKHLQEIDFSSSSDTAS